MLKIGLLGAGHLGKIHLKCIGLLPEVYELVGFYDPNAENAAKVSEEMGLKAFAIAEAMIAEVDVVDIVTPTITHFEMASMAIKAGKHVFIEKPLTHTVEEGQELIRLSKEHGIKVQVGHVERFNPALLAMEKVDFDPKFVECHRLATFNPRGTDVSVVHDLMIHDLDILLSMVKSPIKRVFANGVAILSPTADIANARVEFENGCVANITASRMSLKQMRKLRVFQHDAYISLDFLDKKAQIVRLYDEADIEPTKREDFLSLDTAKGKKLIHVDMPDIEQVNAIKMELETFASSIENDTLPKVDIEDGYRALQLADEIVRIIEKQLAEQL